MQPFLWKKSCLRSCVVLRCFVFLSLSLSFSFSEYLSIHVHVHDKSEINHGYAYPKGAVFHTQATVCTCTKNVGLQYTVYMCMLCTCIQCSHNIWLIIQVPLIKWTMKWRRECTMSQSLEHLCRSHTFTHYVHCTRIYMYMYM